MLFVQNNVLQFFGLHSQAQKCHLSQELSATYIMYTYNYLFMHTCIDTYNDFSNY